MKIAFIGNLAGTAYMMARPLSSEGTRVKLFISNEEKFLANPNWEEYENESQYISIIHYTLLKPVGSKIKVLCIKLRNLISQLKILKHLLACDVVQSFTGALFQSRLWHYAFSKWRLKPYIACATGSDIREVAMLDSSFKGKLMKEFFEKSAKTLLLNIDMVEISQKLGLKNAEFFPFSIDSSKYSPAVVERAYGHPDDLLIFMPSHLDWGKTDNDCARNSTKGNDRLIRAFKHAIEQGVKAHLVFLDRGPDRLIAKEMVKEYNLEKHVTILPQMKKRELLTHMRMADVIADQFDIGSFGTTGLEAMSCSKPVLIYINNACSDQCYQERPPVMNVKTEEEILEGIKTLSDEKERLRLGEAARSWILKHHDSSVVSERLKALYSSVLKECSNA